METVVMVSPGFEELDEVQTWANALIGNSVPIEHYGKDVFISYISTIDVVREHFTWRALVLAVIGWYVEIGEE